MKSTIEKAEPFRFKQFTIDQDRCPMKVGTDGVLLGAWVSVKNVRTALDIGTGTGVIAIMLAQRTSETVVDAVEIDQQAFEQARENTERSNWAERLKVVHQSIQEFSKTSKHKYDLIVSNPPFFTGGTFSDREERARVRHTIKMPHGDLLTAARSLLSETGKFCVILPLIEGMRFKEMAGQYKLFCTKQTEVRPKADKAIERLLLQFEIKEGEEERDELIIQKGDGNDWTQAYRQLTKDFYLFA